MSHLLSRIKPAAATRGSLLLLMFTMLIASPAVGQDIVSPDSVALTLSDSLTLSLADTAQTDKKVKKVKEKKERTPFKFPNKEHLIGVRGGYALTGMFYNPVRETYKGYPIYKEASILYTYYHDLWDNITFFGVQTGLRHTQYGYKVNNTGLLYEVIQVPLVSQFHVDFWKMRLLLNLGAFAGYRYNALSYNTDTGETDVPVTFDANHIPFDYGLQGGAGFAFHFHPFEIQFEANAFYSMSLIENYAINSNEYYTWGHPYQLMFSVGLFLHIK